jgi:hypothetical protein
VAASGKARRASASNVAGAMKITIKHLSWITAIVTIAACSSNLQQMPSGSNSSLLNAATVSPDLKLRPPELVFNLKHPKSKTEKVLGYAPGGSSHTDCETLGVASVGYERVQGHTGYFLISPLHQGQCEVGFDHSVSGKKLKTKTLPVVVNN